MKVNTLKKIVTLSALLCTSTFIYGQFTGDIDGDFGDGGILWYDYTGSGVTTLMTKLVLDENTESMYFSGSINSSGYNAIIVKADLTGNLSPAFTEGTINYDPFIGLDDQFESIAIQPNGKMVAVGYSIIGAGNSDAIIARFNTDGAFDPTFNGGSPLIFDAGGLDFASDVAIQEDGKIVIIGSYQTDVADLDLFIVRLNSDGSPDLTFGIGGSVVLNTYAGIEMIHNITILENGNIVAAGQAGEDILVLQLDTDGNFDTDFSGDGTLNFKVNGLPSVGDKLIELSDGKLLLSGNTFSDGIDGSRGFIIKLEPNGLFVPDFNGDDATLNLAFESELGLDTTFLIRDMEVLASGQILVAADYGNGIDNLALILVNENGDIDTEFGEAGMRLYNLSGGSLPNKDAQIEVTSTGAVLLAGRVINGVYEDIVTVRLFGDISGLYETELTPFEVKLYPNPTVDFLTLVVEMNNASNLSVQITDLAGKTVFSENFSNLIEGQNNLSLTDAISGLTPGCYSIMTTCEGRTASQLFIKK